ncbi:MAG: nucleoside monophosphate kinase, partial [Holophagales bacterium]|nr:nucleoside monophosphate kinase [Holophagales bacterium]
ARLAQPDAAGGFLLDGYPRTLPQVDTLDGILESGGAVLDHVVMIDAPKPVLVTRALARGRDDDTEEVIETRLEAYREKTEPLVAHYRVRGLLREIDGDQTIEAVRQAILAGVGAA